MSDYFRHRLERRQSREREISEMINLSETDDSIPCIKTLILIYETSFCREYYFC